MSKCFRESSIDASYQVSVHLAKRFQRRNFFRNQPIRNKNSLLWPCLLMDRYEMSNRNRGHSIDAFYHPSVHLNKRFRGEESKKSANQKQESPVAAMFVTDRDRMSNLYRGLSIDASYQVSVYLAKRFQRRRILKNQPIRNKSHLWRPCLLMDRYKISIRYREPSIYASYQVSVHLAKRRRF